MENYNKGQVVGEGTYGCVRKAVHAQTGRIVALKKFRLARGTDEARCCAEREVEALQQVQCEHIISLLEVIPHKGNLVLVFEYMESDLEAVINDESVPLRAADIKAYMQGLLQALHAMHTAGLIHRDVKPNNLLLSASGCMKLADFGSSTPHAARTGRMTSQVFARFYRAPEILLGASEYGCAVDMWAAGCVLGELLLRRVWLDGASEIDQLNKIFEALGSPTEESWPGVTSLPAYISFTPRVPLPLAELLPGVPEEALDLLAGLVALDPAKRLTAEQALQHRYFSCAPAPTPAGLLPKHSRHHIHPHHPPLQELQERLNIPSRPPPTSGHADTAATSNRACCLKRQPSTGGNSAASLPFSLPAAQGCSSSCADMSISTVSTKRSRGMADLDVSTAARCLDLRTSSEFGNTWASTPLSAMLPMSIDNSCGSDTGSGVPDSSVGGLFRMQPSSGDLRYLRQRKVDMDSALNASCGTTPVAAPALQSPLPLLQPYPLPPLQPYASAAKVTAQVTI